MQGSFRVGNLFGIPFYVHFSWFIVLGLFTLTYSSELGKFTELTGLMPLGLGFIVALLLFASVLAHELGHSFVALRQGIDVKSITLFLFGGVASLDRESKTPGEAFWVAIAGPLVSFLLCAVFTALNFATSTSAVGAAITGLLAAINLALALFNLIPGLPLDGGNILKAIVWKITGSPYKGVEFAGKVGQIFGWLAIIGGLFSGRFWYALIGLFLLQNAGGAAQGARVQNKLAAFKAEQAVTPNSPIVPANISLREFANEYIIGKREWRKFLIVDELGRLSGEIAVDAMRAIPTNEWPQVLVGDLMQPVNFEMAIKPEQSLLDVVMLFEKNQITELPVITDNGVVVGLIEKAGIVGFLQQQAVTG
ncbi:site-2 protease family protein [Ancylothrix sp. C2]|uniref:site-2 protease family protein n=1 Tax=Ancylothrix sp. D3o TaxID=2953691 RepID=UPI0021BA3DA8|nr:site-2 protease family protein [Ancylothrix sp. D3o]MCT7949936.1 site-2 protease family protein [Ancylothrix sp. D3o]